MNALAFLLVGSFWGGSFVAIKYAIDVFPPLVAAAIRVGIGTAFLACVYLATGKRFTVEAKRRPFVWLVGLLAQGIPFAFLFWAERSVSPGLAGVMNGTVPLWTFVLGALFLRRLERSSPRVLAGIGLGFAGLLVVYAPMIRLQGEVSELAGVGALLAMAISYAAGTLMNRHLLSGGDRVDLYGSVFQQHVASFTFLTLLVLVSGGGLPPWGTLPSSALLGLLYLGVFSTGVAFLLFYRLIREWGAVRAASVTYVVPPLALLLDYLCFGRAPGGSEVLGTCAILGGVFLIQSARPAAAPK